MRYNSNRRPSTHSRRSLRANSSRRGLNCAESYGWVVENREAREAYDLACEYWGEDSVNADIVNCLSTDELAACLAYIFRMNDFREWEEYQNER